MLLGIPLLGIVLARPQLDAALAARTGIFCAATLLCLFHAYAFNDWSHYHFDVCDRHKGDHPLLKKRMTLNETLSFSILTFGAGLIVYLAALPMRSLFICLSLVFLCILYSNRFTLLKNVPFVSTSIHVVSGSLFFNLGWSTVRTPSTASWLAGLFFGLLYGAGHLSHESIDFEGDRRARLRTTPGVFGLRPVFAASAVGVTLASALMAVLGFGGVVYTSAVAVIFLAAWLAYILAFSRIWPGDLGYADLSRFRTVYRRIYSAAGILALAAAVVGDAKGPVVPRPRVCIVGLDALDPDLVAAWGAQGKLPTLSRLIREGARGRLRSLPGLKSPVIWTTIATGRLPRDHGIVDFTVPGKDGARVPATADFRRVKALWEMATESGLSSGFINWWPSFPAERVDGFMVSNYFRYLYADLAAPGGVDRKRLAGLEGLSWPPELALSLADKWPSGGGFLDEIDAETVFAIPFPGGYDPVRERSFPDGRGVFRYAVAGDAAVFDLARDLVRERPVDLFAVYVEGIDVFSHLFWGYAHPDRYPVNADEARVLGPLLEKYYRYTDRRLGELLAALPRECRVLVLSDHGYGDVGGGRHFHREEGFLAMAGPGIQAGTRLDSPGVADITPTVLYLLDLPVSRQMPGRVLMEAFTPAFRASRPVEFKDSWEDGPRERSRPAVDPRLQEGAMERLRALGYIQ